MMTNGETTIKEQLLKNTESHGRVESSFRVFPLIPSVQIIRGNVCIRKIIINQRPNLPLL